MWEFNAVGMILLLSERLSRPWKGDMEIQMRLTLPRRLTGLRGVKGVNTDREPSWHCQKREC